MLILKGSTGIECFRGRRFNVQNMYNAQNFVDIENYRIKINTGQRMAIVNPQ